MRVLSISRPLANRAIDNHTIFNAPAIFDYDAVVIDPAGIFRSVREAVSGSGDHETHSGVPVVNGDAGPGAPISEILLRRRDEVLRALEHGAVVAVVTQPQGLLNDVIGLHGLDRYFFLPAPTGISWDRNLVHWGEGSTATVVEPAHPFAPFIDAIRSNVQYRAYFNERAEGFAKAATVFARSTGGAPLGAEFKVLAGRVVFLPAAEAPSVEVRLDHGRAAVAAMRELLGHLDDDQQPRWLRDESLPGIAERQAELSQAQSRLRSAEEEAASAERAALEVEYVREVLWREGRFALLPAVLRCAELLGYRVAGADEGEPRLLAAEGALVIEAEGSSQRVGIGPHYRLRARLDAQLARDGTAGRGLIVVNGDRLRGPAARSEQFDDALRVGAESTRYALLTATELFAAARAAMAGADEATLSAVRLRLAETDGVVTLGDLLGEGASPTAASESTEN